MAIIFTRAHVPEELQGPWLQHLRDFDIAHPGCHFEVMIDGAPDVSATEAAQMLRVNPELTFQQIFERRDEACTICGHDCHFMPGSPPPPPECRIQQIAAQLRREFLDGE